MIISLENVMTFYAIVLIGYVICSLLMVAFLIFRSLTILIESDPVCMRVVRLLSHIERSTIYLLVGYVIVGAILK